MSPTLTGPKDRSATFPSSADLGEGGSNEESSASTDAKIFRGFGYFDITEFLKPNVEITEHKDDSEHEIPLRRIEASPENLLSWGRGIERGEGDKVDVDI